MIHYCLLGLNKYRHPIRRAFSLTNVTSKRRNAFANSNIPTPAISMEDIQINSQLYHSIPNVDLELIFREPNGSDPSSGVGEAAHPREGTVKMSTDVTVIMSDLYTDFSHEPRSLEQLGRLEDDIGTLSRVRRIKGIGKTDEVDALMEFWNRLEGALQDSHIPKETLEGIEEGVATDVSNAGGCEEHLEIRDTDPVEEESGNLSRFTLGRTIPSQRLGT
ncbi:hypothetical protein IAT40_003560 [Kwoniella sp. CBS 6097]